MTRVSIPPIVVTVKRVHDVRVTVLNVVEVLRDGSVGVFRHASRVVHGYRGDLFLQFCSPVLEPDLHLSTTQRQISWGVVSHSGFLETQYNTDSQTLE